MRKKLITRNCQKCNSFGTQRNLPISQLCNSVVFSYQGIFLVKGSAIISWLGDHHPNPWPEATVKVINNMIRYLKVDPEFNEMKLHSKSLRSFKVRWDHKRPKESSILKWRRNQIRRYLQKYPAAKGKQVKIWIKSHNPDPWPEAEIRALNKLIRRLKISAALPTDEWNRNNRNTAQFSSRIVSM